MVSPQLQLTSNFLLTTWRQALCSAAKNSSVTRGQDHTLAPCSISGRTQVSAYRFVVSTRSGPWAEAVSVQTTVRWMSLFVLLVPEDFQNRSNVGRLDTPPYERTKTTDRTYGHDMRLGVNDRRYLTVFERHGCRLMNLDTVTCDPHTYRESTASQTHARVSWVSLSRENCSQLGYNITE